MNNFENDLAELLEVEKINDDDVLKNYECWDSLTVLSIIAWADDKYNATLSAREINDSKTVLDLKTLIETRKKLK